MPKKWHLPCHSTVIASHSMVPSASGEVPDTWYKVRTAKFLIHGAKCVPRNSWYMVPCASREVPDTWCKYVQRSYWYMVPIKCVPRTRLLSIIYGMPYFVPCPVTTAFQCDCNTWVCIPPRLVDLSECLDRVSHWAWGMTDHVCYGPVQLCLKTHDWMGRLL